MARSIFSSSWHSVAALKPRLLPQARVHRHVYRQQVWYVAQDQTGGRFHRMSPGAYALLKDMDGATSVQQLWERANGTESGDAVTQNEVVDLLLKLHAADLLQVDVTPDSAALFERLKKKRRTTLKQWLLNPMSLKIPLLDPDDFLTRWAPRLAWCFATPGLIVWLLAVLPAVILAAQHWSELTHNLSDRVLSSSNLWVMALAFPVVKLLHELGHGFAAKVWGGSVHQMGLMFLVFAPVPYVDASSSSAFPSKYRRATVAAAGMLAELFLAALALYVWLLTEPGLARAFAFNVMVVSGVSTLIVNGNPLLKYDGYYIFTDLIEMPNMAQRGQKYLAYLWDRYVFRAHDVEPPVETSSEKRWLVAYTPLAWCYRVFITVSIILFVGTEFFIFGVLIAMWSAFSLFVMPLWKAYRHVVRSPTLQRRRKQAVRTSMALLSALLLVLFFVPLPLHTRADGVVWLPDQSIVRAGESGFFIDHMAPPGSYVRRGQPLFSLRDALLTAELEVAKAKVTEAQAKYEQEQFVEPVKAAVSLRQLRQAQEVLQRAGARADKLVVYSQTDGMLIMPLAQDMPDRYFKKGELLGYVLAGNALIARVIVGQDDVGLLRQGARGVQVRLAERIEQVLPARLVREVPAAVSELPTAALGIGGGGSIATEPSDPKGLKTIQRVFMVDLQLPPEADTARFGERVHVRFDHGFEPIAWQGMRRLRQLFLSRFNV